MENAREQQTETPRFGTVKKIGWTLFALTVLGVILSSDSFKPAPPAPKRPSREEIFLKARAALGTPKAFQASCGRATRIEHLGSPNYEPRTIRLDYCTGFYDECIRVYFTEGVSSDPGVDALLHGRVWEPTTQDDEREMLNETGCKLPPVLNKYGTYD